MVERRPPPPPPPPKPKREAPPLDEYGYVGLGVTGLGVAAAVAGGVLLYLATTRASAIAADACPAGPNCPMKGGKPNPYYFNDPNASPNDFDFQNQGHLYNNAGIGLVVAGGVLAAAGVAFTIVDNVLIAPARWKSHPHKAKEKDKEHRPDGDSAPYIPQSSIEHLHVTPVLGPNVAGLSAGFSF